FERQGVQRSAETNATSPLRSRRKHRQRICRDRKLLKEVVIDHGVHIESRLIRVLDLPHDLPGLVIMRLARRSLHLAIDSKSHQALLRQINFRLNSEDRRSRDTSRDEIAAAVLLAGLRLQLQR